MIGLKKITPYVAGEQPKLSKMIKINTNENAFPPSPKVLATLKEFDGDQLRLYSSLENENLTSALSKKLGISSDCITTGNGSDDVLALAFQSFFNSEYPVVFPDITYGFYTVWCELFDIPYMEIPLDDDFHPDFTKIPEKIGGIVLANPNAPTGIVQPLSKIEELLQCHPNVVVIVDEAYIEFGGKSAVALLDKYENLYITRTFSKDASLAGLRVGYGVGNKRLTEVIKAVKNAYNPYSVDQLAEALALAATQDSDYYREMNGKIIETREWLSKEVTRIGFNVLPSATNFILAEHERVPAGEIFDFLRENHVFVRYFPNKERIANFLRISIGTREEMEVVLKLLSEFVKKIEIQEQ
ncbi:histidinol-phosphate aminotransferase [Pilibacter termitis]|uniref:Histidinol-phosphate aminotransferase n=1 Tax=Pilibacter termitis TaxID=263852 RepID=A0A1T4LPB5_9ENTE|nr:histidinol-phosphate transaminase [Pilibacter termitis]SJZ56477.1 histidinol-phosphate aminotransferase [Pilibacter termitis]